MYLKRRQVNGMALLIPSIPNIQIRKLVYYGHTVTYTNSLNKDIVTASVPGAKRIGRKMN